MLGEGFVNNDENSTCVCGNGFVLNVSVCDPIPTGCDDHRCSVEDNSERHRVCQLHVPSSRSERVPQRAINVEFTAENTKFENCNLQN